MDIVPRIVILARKDASPRLSSICKGRSSPYIRCVENWKVLNLAQIVASSMSCIDDDRSSAPVFGTEVASSLLVLKTTIGSLDMMGGKKLIIKMVFINMPE